MANDLIQIGIDVKTNIKQATGDLDKMGGSVVKNVQSFDRLESEVKQLNNALAKGRVNEAAYSKGMKQINNELLIFQQRAAKSAQVERKFGAAAASGGKSMNRFNVALQQGGFQLQDFAVQMQSGTSFFTAFGQQGSQFAGIFGPSGAVIGAVIAIGSAIGGIALKSIMAGNAVKDFGEQLKDTSSSVSEYISLASKADDVFADVFKSSSAALNQSSQAAKDLLMIAKTDALDSIRGLGKSLGEANTEAGFWAKTMMKSDKSITGNLLNIETGLRGNITSWKAAGKQVKLFIDDVRNIGQADSIDGMYESAIKARDTFKETVDVTGEMTDKQKGFWKELSTTILKLEQMGAASKAAMTDMDISAFGGEGQDLEALTKAREEAEKAIAKIRRANAIAFFKDEQAVQNDIHQVWVKNNAEQNKKRLDDIKVAKKSRRDAGLAFFKDEQTNEAAIQGQRIKNIIAELKAKKDAEVTAMAIRRAAGMDYGREQDEVQAQMQKVVVDRIFAEHEARVKADQDAIDLRRAAGLSYAKKEQELENSIHQVRVDNILTEGALREAMIDAARAKFNAGAANAMAGEGASETVAAENLAKRIKELQDAWYDLNKEKEDANKDALKIKKALEAEAKQMNLGANATAKYADSYAKLVELKKHGLGDEAFANEVAALNEELANSEPVLTGFTDAFTDFLSRGATDFKSFAKDIMDMFKNMIVKMIAMAARNKIMLSMGMGGSVAATGLSAATGGGGSFMGSMGGVGGAGASGLMGGAMSSLGGFASGGLSGGFSAIGSAMSGATGTIGTFGAAVGAIAAPILAVTAVFSFFKKSTKQLDVGLQGTLKTLDFTIESFSKIQTKRFWGLSKKTSESSTALSAEEANPLIEGLTAMQQGIMNAAEALGYGSTVFNKFSHDFKLSLAGLNEDQKMAKIAEEFTKMGDSFASLIPHIGSMQELSDVMQQRMGLEAQLLVAEGDIVEIRKQELSTIHLLNKSLAARLQLLTAEADMGTALQAFAAGIAEQQGLIQRAVDALVSPLQEALDRTRDAAKDSYKIFREASGKARTEAKAFVDILRGALNSRKIKSEAVELQSYRTSQQQLASFAGGAEFDKESLGKAAQGVSIDSQKFFGSFEDYARDFYKTQHTLEELEEKAAKELTDVEVQIAIAEKAYKMVMGTYKESVDMNTSMDTLLSDLAAYAEVAARNEPFIAQIKAEGDRQIEVLDDILVATTKVVNAELGIASTVADLVGSNVKVGDALLILGIKEGEMAGAVLALSTPLGVIGSHIADFDTSLAGAYDRLGINLNALLDLDIAGALETLDFFAPLHNVDLTGALTEDASTLAAKAGELKVGLVTTDGLINTFTNETEKTAANLLTLNGTVITQTTQIGALGVATDDLGIDITNLGTTLTTAMGSLGSLVGGLSGAVTGLATAQNALAAAQEVANSAAAADAARAAAAAKAAADAKAAAAAKVIADAADAAVVSGDLGGTVVTAAEKAQNLANEAYNKGYKNTDNSSDIGDTRPQSRSDVSSGGSSFSEAVSSGWDKVKSAFGFARGGMHQGGLRIVGEEGPELEATGPSRIYTKKDTASMLSGGSESVVAELRSLRHEVSELKAEQRKVGVENVKYNKKSYDLYREWDTVGLPATRTS